MIDLDTQSIRAQILQKVGERCQAMLVKLPGGSDSEPEVYWAKKSLDYAKGEIPGAVVFPFPETLERNYGGDVITMPVQISLVCLLGEHNAVDLAESLLSELRKAIPADDQTFDGLADDCRYIQGGVDDYPERDDQALVVNATFEIEYQTLANNPDEGA